MASGSTTPVHELRLMGKGAQLYYRQGINQSDIARRLDLSQATISRLLKRAVAEGIVRITVNLPVGVYADLEDALVQTYGLREAIVVDCEDPRDEPTIQQIIGAAAAYYVESTLKPGDVIGISSWSATLLAMVDAMHPLTRPSNARVVQILGGVGNPDAQIHAARLTDRLSRLVQGRAVSLPAPGIVGSEDARRILLEDPFVTEAVALFDLVTIALVGIGAIQPSELLARSGNVFAREELEAVREMGAVGDICMRFFDADGVPVNSPLDKRVIGMSLEQFQKVERTVAAAGGERKWAAIRGALRGRLVNVLITDRWTAEALLRPAE